MHTHAYALCRDFTYTLYRPMITKKSKNGEKNETENRNKKPTFNANNIIQCIHYIYIYIFTAAQHSILLSRTCTARCANKHHILYVQIVVNIIYTYIIYVELFDRRRKAEINTKPKQYSSNNVWTFLPPLDDGVQQKMLFELSIFLYIITKQTNTLHININKK